MCVVQDDRDAVHMDQEEHVSSYLELQQQLAAAKAAMRAVVTQPRHILPFLQPGRLVNIAASAAGIQSFPYGDSILQLRVWVHVTKVQGTAPSGFVSTAVDQQLMASIMSMHKHEVRGGNTALPNCAPKSVLYLHHLATLLCDTLHCVNLKLFASTVCAAMHCMVCQGITGFQHSRKDGCKAGV